MIYGMIQKYTDLIMYVHKQTKFQNGINNMNYIKRFILKLLCTKKEKK